MVEPLDPDTLAEGERLDEKERTTEGLDSYYQATDDLSGWLWLNRAALLAVARDHARLTASKQALVDKVKRLEDRVAELHYENQALISDRAASRAALAASVEAPTDDRSWDGMTDGEAAAWDVTDDA
jgi:hypothetical protein